MVITSPGDTLLLLLFFIWSSCSSCPSCSSCFFSCFRFLLRFCLQGKQSAEYLKGLSMIGVQQIDR